MTGRADRPATSDRPRRAHDVDARQLLNRRRLTVYPRIFIALYIVIIVLWWFVGADGRLDPTGTPVGGDFVTFYGASELLGDGDADALYERDQLHAVEQAIVDSDIGFYAWHYPPPFMLVVEPLRTVSYGAALAIWLSISLVGYLAVVRWIESEPLAIGLALGFAGFFQNVLHGQNGVLTLALLAAGLMLLDRRPAVGGALLGLLIYKPHFLPLAGLALLASRRWTALVGMVLSCGIAIGVSTWVYGFSAWEAFVDNLSFAQEVFYEGGIDWEKMPTLSSALLLLGAPVGVAKAAQLVFGAAVAAVVAVAWRTDHRQKASILVIAALLATPFAFEYDLTILALPLVWIARDGRQSGWLRGDRAALVAGWVLPLLLASIATLTRVQVGPIVLTGLLYVAWRRRDLTDRVGPEPALVASRGTPAVN